MSKYEYEQIQIEKLSNDKLLSSRDNKYYKSIIEILDIYGKKGWRIVAISNYYFSDSRQPVTVLFEREEKEDTSSYRRYTGPR